eukprot:PhF_6_TR42097/c0_g1_i2/m.63543/K01204/NAGA; alpha-N-acetylgalactosaminidase
MNKSVFILLVLTFTFSANALKNGLALTPPMGWMAWQRFRCITDCANYPNDCVSDALLREQGRILAADYLKAGYNGIHIDDCYLAGSRNATTGKLYADPARFPQGMAGLGNYLHSIGIQFALYEDIGTLTCGGYPGILGHFPLDAQTFVEWGGDYLKLDGCYVDNSQMATLYPQMGQILNQTKRPFVYSCSWPAYLNEQQKVQAYPAIQQNCNLWRLFDDIQDSWDSVVSIANYWGDNQDVLTKYAGPGSWNDPDMLIIGGFGLSEDQSQYQMAIWAIIAAPLIMGNDLRQIKQWQKDILLNTEIIAVNQDPLGIQGRRITPKQDQEVWSRPLANGDLSVALVNKGISNGVAWWVEASLSSLGLQGTVYCRDLYAHAELGAFNQSIRLLVNGSGGVRMLRCRKNQ